MNTEELQVTRDEIHKKIDDNFNIILKNMSTVFENIKFNDIHFVEETNNLEILTSTESISARLYDLAKIVNDMKVEHVKKNEFIHQSRKNLQKDIHKVSSEINSKVFQLQENYNFINTLLKENKHTKYYKYSVNFDNE
jgi:hypothetical protein